MGIRELLLEILLHYKEAKTQAFAKNKFIDKIKKESIRVFDDVVSEYGDRYKIKASLGSGRWSECPWIAILDKLVTSSAQRGYYIVFLFSKDMNCVYLSLNQGVTDIINNYKRKNPETILSRRAADIRDQLILKENVANYITSELVLQSSLWRPKLYNKGNILAKCYSKDKLPNEDILLKDLRLFIDYYQQIIISDSSEDLNDAILDCNSLEERKIRRLHARFDRQGNIAKKVKQRKKYKCEVCGLTFTDKYGDIGKNYIEAHHLIPFNKLKEGVTKLDIDNDFAVLCSNCHRMIHKLNDPADLDGLRDKLLCRWDSRPL